MSATTTGSLQPRASAVAMFPAPMSPIFTGGAYLRPGLGLVEEALLDKPRALFRRDLDVARSEKEDLVGDALHPAVEGEGQARGEVDQPLRQFGVRCLQVEDHRHRVLEAVSDLLAVVEVLRHDHLALDDRPSTAAVAAVAPGGAQDTRLASGRAALVGEDVIDLVAPATVPLESSDVRPHAITALDLLLGLDVEWLL